MPETLLILLIALLLIVIILQIVFRPKADNNLPLLQEKLVRLEGGSARLEQLVREELRISREETAGLVRDNRTELGDTLRADARQGRESIEKAFDGFRQSFNEAMGAFKDLQREKFGQLEEKQNALIKQTEEKLEKMRETVDEKLTKTLSERLGQSFEQVSKHLESVQQGLGEMKTLATDVGGLKKVLSNVKLRGGMGEVQLAMLLEQILSPTQYDANVKTKQGSNDPVEFAIKLPGRSEDEGSHVYLPIDAKFPKDIYEQLLQAYDQGNPEEVETASRNLELTIRKMAKDIRDKYIDPPHTTDFALLFLPFEGIYAEVVRRSALIDQLQREYNVAVAGPSTLTAYLNSLQMGFRTLALQKRSSEVWQILGAVKTEFEKFGGMLEKAQKNIHAASDTVDDLLGKRTRAITRKLKQVESLPAAEAQQLLPEIGAAEEGEEE
jgi:DNA recombination protein RmuC